VQQEAEKYRTRIVQLPDNVNPDPPHCDEAVRKANDAR
jgi:hypothetical protein